MSSWNVIQRRGEAGQGRTRGKQQQCAAGWKHKGRSLRPLEKQENPFCISKAHPNNMFTFKRQNPSHHSNYVGRKRRKSGDISVTVRGVPCLQKQIHDNGVRHCLYRCLFIAPLVHNGRKIYMSTNDFYCKRAANIQNKYLLNFRGLSNRGND